MTDERATFLSSRYDVVVEALGGWWSGSLALYTSLIEQHRTAQFLFERGQTWLWSGDTRRAESDLLASEALEPRAETGDPAPTGPPAIPA